MAVYVTPWACCLHLTMKYFSNGIPFLKSIMFTAFRYLAWNCLKEEVKYIYYEVSYY